MDDRTRAFLLALALDPDAPAAAALPAEAVDRLAAGTVTRPETYDVRGKAVAGGLFCESLFGAPGRFGRLDLPRPVPHPLLPDAALQALLVLPAELRPYRADGEPSLNDGYRRVVNRATRLRRLVELEAPPVLLETEASMLEEAVGALFRDALAPALGLDLDAIVAGSPLPEPQPPEDQLRRALVAFEADPAQVGPVLTWAQRVLSPERLYEDLLFRWLDEGGWGSTRRREVREALGDALFAALDPEHPAWARAARGRVDRLAQAGALEAALEVAEAADDLPLRRGVLEAALGRGTARLEEVAAATDPIGWQGRTELALHHLRGNRVDHALGWLLRAADAEQPSLLRRPVGPPPLPEDGDDPALRIVGEIASCVHLNGLLNVSTLSGLLRLARVVPEEAGERLRAQALEWVRGMASARDERGCDDVRDLARYLTNADASPEAVAVFEAALDGWPAGYDRNLLENGLALALGRAGRPGEEIALLQALAARLAGDPGATVVRTSLGSALLREARAEEAAAVFRGLLTEDGGADAATGLAYALVQLGDPDGARDTMRPWWDELPEDEVATEGGGRVAEALLSALLALRDPDAEQVQRRLLAATRARYRDQPPTWMEEANLGSVLAALGRPADAIPVLEAALQQQHAYGERSTDALRTRRNLIRTLRAAGRDADADALEAPLAALEANAVTWVLFDPLAPLRR